MMRKAAIQSKKSQRMLAYPEKPAHVMRVNMAEGMLKQRAPRAHSCQHKALIYLDILVLDDTFALASVSKLRKRSVGERGFGRKLKATNAPEFIQAQEDDNRATVGSKERGRRMP